MKLLCVPIHVDALVAPDKTPVIGPGADFSALPYQDAKQNDIRFDTANLISSIRKGPFENEGALPPGVHLHWALPDALTHGKVDGENGLRMPEVPNRWLVRRIQKGEIKAWIVESDYLHPVGSQPGRAVCIPFYDGAGAGEPPWRHLGRQLPVSDWFSEQQAGKTTHERYAPLHVLGWGTPWFSALYAECFSVFGCYDEEITSAGFVAGVTYEVFGWYAEPGKDYLATRLLSELNARIEAEAATGKKAEAKGETPEKPRTDEEILAEVAESVAGWKIETGGGDSPLPERMLCFGRVEFSEDPKLDDDIDIEKTQLAMARTGGEALSAWISKGLVAGSDADPNEDLRIENQIQALLFADRVRGENVDFINRLKDARHREGFDPVDGGSLWDFIDEGAIRVSDKSNDASEREKEEEKLKKKLRELKGEKRAALSQLNALQEEANRVGLAMETWRERLYADWSKYMLCRYPTDRLNDGYPDSDLIRHFIESRTLPELERLARRKERLDGDITALRTEMDDALKDKLREIRLLPGEPVTLLRKIPGSRYWRPKEPSLLVAGKVAEPSWRYGRDGELHCQIREIAEESLDAWVTGVDSADSASDPIPGLQWDGMAHNPWSRTPWLPMFLEWRMALYPDSEAISQVEGNLEPYDPDFIIRHYRIPLNDAEFSLPSAAVDMRPRGGKNVIDLSETANIVTGRTLLTFGVRKVVEGQLDDYLKEKFQEKGVSDFAAYLESDTRENITFADPIHTIGRSMEFLDASPCMGQRLDGLHDEWLMRRSGLSLPVADPFRFIAENDAFTRRVREKLGKRSYKLPSPYHRFTPIRSGVAKLLDLRIIDTFGRFKDISCKEIFRPQRDLAGSAVYLPPRLIPPARLDFRWIMQGPALGDCGVETPLLGWLLYNLFDETLVIYDAHGKYLGAVNSDGEWEGEPGKPNRVELSAITDRTLRRFVAKILGFHADNRLQKSDFLDAQEGDEPLWDALVAAEILQPYGDGRKAYIRPGVLPDEPNEQRWKILREKLRKTHRNQNHLPALKRAIRRAQDNIDPEGDSTASGSGMVERALAIVRARLSLELMGIPDISKSWAALEQDLRNNGRSRRKFTAVRFPVKLGEFRNLDDALVAYWPETETGQLARTGYFPQSDMGDVVGNGNGNNGDTWIDAASFHQEDHDFIDASKAEGVANLSLALDDPPLTFTMLVDPEGAIHATTGIVPKKPLRLEPAMYREALSRIECSFFAAPFLTPADRSALPLPPDGPWLWRQPEGKGAFSETPGLALINKVDFLEKDGMNETIWDKLVQASVLRPYCGGDSGKEDAKEAESAFHNPVPEGAAPESLRDDWAAIAKALVKSRGPSIHPLANVPLFSARTRAVEGWIAPMGEGAFVPAGEG